MSAPDRSPERNSAIFLVQPGEPSYGRYGRLLGHLIDEDGRNLNEAMIRGGWATYYTKYGEGRFPEEFREAEVEAQGGGLGIWGRLTASLRRSRSSQTAGALRWNPGR